MSYRTFFLLVFLVNTAAFAQSNVVTFEPTDTDPQVSIIKYHFDEDYEYVDDGSDVVNLKSYLAAAPANKIYYDPRTLAPEIFSISAMLTGNQNVALMTNTYAYDYGTYIYSGWYDWTISKQNMAWNPNWSAEEKSAAANGYGTYELAAAPGLGVDSDAYSVCYVDLWNNYNGYATIDFMTPSDLEKIFVTNTTLTVGNIVAGNQFSTAFNQEGDHFTLTIKGFTLDDDYNHVYSPDMSVDVPLALFENGELFLLDSWKEVDLSAFKGVDGLDFTLETSDVGQYGPNTPYYFAIDSLTFASAVPDPSGSGVPEPSTWALFVLGMAGMAVYGRKFSLKK